MTHGEWMIIEEGGKQHLVAAGGRFTANRPTANVGETVQATNLLDGAKVTLTVVAHTFGPKINGLKFKNKVRYLKRYGHRQEQAVFEVGGAKAAPVATTKKPTTKAKKVSK